MKKKKKIIISSFGSVLLLFAYFFVLLWFRLPLAKSRDKEKKGNKRKVGIKTRRETKWLYLCIFFLPSPSFLLFLPLEENNLFVCLLFFPKGDKVFLFFLPKEETNTSPSGCKKTTFFLPKAIPHRGIAFGRKEKKSTSKFNSKLGSTKG